MYDLEQDFNGHKFRKYLIGKKKGLANSTTSGNSMSNIVLEKIHQVLENLVRNYNINKTYVK